MSEASQVKERIAVGTKVSASTQTHENSSLGWLDLLIVKRSQKFKFLCEMCQIIKCCLKFLKIPYELSKTYLWTKFNYGVSGLRSGLGNRKENANQKPTLGQISIESVIRLNGGKEKRKTRVK